MKPARVLDLQRREYGEAWKLQQELVAARQRGEIADTLVLVEHPNVITLGRRQSAPANVVAAGDIPIFEIERGGDVTYHGPGQLVGYPIFDLNPDRRDVHQYVRDLEEALIRAVATFGVEARRLSGLTGVWTGPAGAEEKLAAIGVRISRWITSHGFALNVTTDLSDFALIVPCGIADHGVTSLERLLGRPVPMTDVEDAAVEGMRSVFGAP
mgnify:CR=1 FL=1